MTIQPEADTSNRAKNAMADQSGLWGSPVEIWDTRGFWLMIVGAGLGTIALLVSLASSFILYSASGATQTEIGNQARKSAERVSVLSKEVEVARAAIAASNAEIAKANARIAEADARTKEAELQLRKQLAPRFLGQKFLDALGKEPGCRVLISYARDAGDTYGLAMQVLLMLPNANGWVVEHLTAITDEDRLGALRRHLPEGMPIHPAFDVPGTVALRAQPSGVTVVSGPGFEPLADPDVTKSKTPAGALARAFVAELGSVAYGGDPDLPDKTLRIVIAPKP